MPGNATLQLKIEDAVKETKGAGSRKLQHHIREHCSGISEQRIKQHLESSREYSLLQTRFTNRPVLKPVSARDVQVRHQIDLIDMHPREVCHNGATFRYILTVMDVFSRFLWAQPLTTKRSAEIARNLKNIYDIHGPPRIIQHGQGKEFDGAVVQLMHKMNVKIVRSSPYHPQSQGKVERSHRSIRRKFTYDLLQQVSTNWVRSLANYCAILNNECREELGYRSAFSVYYGRKNNVLKNRLGMDNPIVQRCERLVGNNGLATERDLHRCTGARWRMTGKVRAASKRCSDRMVNKGIRRNPPSIYRIGDEVLVRIHHPKRRPKGQLVTVGTVLKRNLYTARYKVQYIDKGNIQQKWFSVKNVTSTTRSLEKDRPKMGQVPDRLRRGKRMNKSSKYYIVLNRGDWVLSRFGFSIRLDPTPNGDCQFSAVADQHETIGVHRSAETLRQEVVSDLRRNPILHDGTPLDNFVGRNNLLAYLMSMSHSGTFGDHITLSRMSEMFNVQFIVFSSLGPQATRLISPYGTFDDIPVLFLGHEAEGCGEHYYSLSADYDRQREAMTWFEERTESSRGMHDQVGLGTDDEGQTQSASDGGGDDEVGLENGDDGQRQSASDSDGDGDGDGWCLWQERRESSQGVDDEVGLESGDDGQTDSGGATEVDWMTFPLLPPELITIIVGMAVHADLRCIQRCSLVSRLFKDSCDRHCRSCNSCGTMRRLMGNLRPVHVRPELAADLGLGDRSTMSVRRLMKNVGRSSGLGMALEDMLSSHHHWWSSWVTLIPAVGWGPNWYRIVHVFWK